MAATNRVLLHALTSILQRELSLSMQLVLLLLQTPLLRLSHTALVIRTASQEVAVAAAAAVAVVAAVVRAAAVAVSGVSTVASSPAQFLLASSATASATAATARTNGRCCPPLAAHCRSSAPLTTPPPCVDTCSDDARAYLRALKQRIDRYGSGLKARTALLGALPAARKQLQIEGGEMQQASQNVQSQLQTAYAQWQELVASGRTQTRDAHGLRQHLGRGQGYLRHLQARLHAIAHLLRVDQPSSAVPAKGAAGAAAAAAAATSFLGDDDSFVSLYEQCYEYIWERRRYGDLGAEIDRYRMTLCPLHNATQQLVETLSAEKAAAAAAAGTATSAAVSEEKEAEEAFVLGYFDGHVRMRAEPTDVETLQLQLERLESSDGETEDSASNGDSVEQQQPPQPQQQRRAALQQQLAAAQRREENDRRRVQRELNARNKRMALEARGASSSSDSSSSELEAMAEVSEPAFYLRLTDGQSCWQGPPRSTVVECRCGAATQLINARENGKCRYEFVLLTPAACSAQHWMDLKQMHQYMHARLRLAAATAATASASTAHSEPAGRQASPTPHSEL